MQPKPTPFFMMFMKHILNLFLTFVTSLLGLSCIAESIANPSQNVCVKPIVKKIPAEPLITNPINTMDNSNYLYDDWVADSQSILCKGYYLEPSVPFPGQSQIDLDIQPTSVTSEQGQFISEGNSILIGNVHLSQGNRQAFADRVVIHRSAKKTNTSTNAFDWIQATGHVKITEPGMRVDGTNADINLEENTEIIQNAHFRLYDRHARGAADTITIKNHNRLIMKNASYTTCSPFSNTWYLKANNVDLNQITGRGRARHARLYFKDVPIFYTPYIDFPIDDRRKTGFLFPGFGVSNRSGVELATPFYWNIAPNYDATVTPRYLSKRGVEWQGLFRYLSSNSIGEIEAGILPDDRAYRRFLEQKREDIALLKPNDPLLRDPRVTALNRGGPTRQAFRANHITTFNPNWVATFQYQTVSDDNYFMDFGNTLGLASTTQLLQQGDLTFQDQNWKVMTRLQQYQTLHPFNGAFAMDVYRRLPQLAFQNVYTDLPGGLEWTTNGEFSRFLHKHDSVTQTPFTTGDRVHLLPGISLPLITPGWFLKPRVQFYLLAYSLSLSPQDIKYSQSKAPALVVPIYDLDSGLIFERNYSAFGEDYLQTLEPRAYYLYVPFENQSRFPIFDTSYPGFDYNQLYRYNRFSGLDRIGDANQLTLSVTTRFFSEAMGNEQVSLTLGQIQYFKRRRVTLCHPQINPRCLEEEFPNLRNHHSSFVGLARIYLQEAWSANAEVEWDPYKNRRDKEAFSLQYLPDDRTVFNIGYQFLRRNPARTDPETGLPERLDQSDISLAFAVTERLRILGRWHYDLKNQRSNDISFGIEQQGCCTALRLYVSRFLEPYDLSQQPLFSHNRYSNAVFLQFIFKGFVGVGHNKMTSNLKRAIPGYQWRVDDF